MKSTLLSSCLHRLLAYSFVVFPFSGCIPFPHTRLIVPPQEGLLLTGGKAAPGLKVLQSFTYGDKSCRQVGRESITDEQGRFAFEGSSDFFFFVSMGDDYHYSYTCAEYEGQPKLLTSSVVVHETPNRIRRVVCELTTTVREEVAPEKRGGLPGTRCKEIKAFQ